MASLQAGVCTSLRMWLGVVVRVGGRSSEAPPHPTALRGSSLVFSIKAIPGSANGHHFSQAQAGHSCRQGPQVGGALLGGGPLCGWGQGQGRHGESQLVPSPLCLDWMRSDSRLGHSAVGASLTLCGNPDLKDPWASPGMRFFISLIPSSGHSAWGRGTHWLRASPGCSRSLATFGEEMKSGKTHRSERELVHIKHLPCSRHCVQHFKCADPSSL